MRYITVLIAGVALSGCDVTFGSDGPVVTTSDSIVGQMIPVGNRAAPVTDQTPPAGVQSTPSTNSTAPVAPRRPFSLNDIVTSAVLPAGTTQAEVEQFQAAVAGEGCTISNWTQREAIESQTGFDAEKQEIIRDYLWRAGELDRNSGSYRLKSGPCADA